MKAIILSVALFLLLAFIIQQSLMLKNKTSQKRSNVQEKDGIYVFTSPVCAVCVRMKGMHAALMARSQIQFVDVMEHPDTADRYHIKSVPTTVIVRDGKIAQLFYGLVTPSELALWLTVQPKSGGEHQ